MINSGSFIIKRTLKCSLLLVCSLLSVILFSCAGGACGGGAGGGEATALCVQLPGTVGLAATQYQKVDSNFQTFTVTIDSSSYKATKSCGSGETLKFENIPVGHYDVVAFAKRADGNVTAKGTASVDIEADVTKTVKITLNRLKYATVTFYNGEDVYATQEITEGYTAKKPATNPTDPSGDGREFSFWGISSGATSGFDFNTSISDDQSLYAVYGLATYNITFDYNGYTQGGNSSSSIPVRENDVPPAPTLGTRTNYTLMGWATSDDATEDDVLDPIPEATEAVTYYAVWKPDEYTITYSMPDDLTITVATNDSSGKPFAKYTYSPTAARTLPVETDLSENILHFEGWYTDTDYTTLVTSVPAGSTGNKTYYAKFSRLVTIYLEKIEGSGWGAILASDVTAVIGKPLAAPAAVASASKPGYTPAGWKSGRSGEEVSFVFGSTLYGGSCTGVIWGEWTEGSVTNFNGTLAQFSALDFTIDGTGTAENPCPVTVTGISGSSPSSDLSAITSKLTEYRIGTDPGVYCTLDLSSGNFTTVPSMAFECAGYDDIGNRGIVGITLPNTVTTIEYGAFYGSNLTGITLPTSLQSIGESAFYASYGLTSVTIPNSVTTINMTAFESSGNLETFTAPGTWTLYDGDGNAVVSGITLDATKMKDPSTVLSGYSGDYYYQKD